MRCFAHLRYVRINKRAPAKTVSRFVQERGSVLNSSGLTA
jgi:hypothetical protein